MSTVIEHQFLSIRDDIPSWLKVCGYHRLAEIGVRAGVGLKLLARAHPSRLIAVDLWSAQGVKSQNDAPISQTRLDTMYQDVLGLNAYWPFLRVIREHSVRAAAGVEDGSLDFVFIDADHTYEAVAADIAAWWPKVRVGGTLAGHDYVNHTLDNGVKFGVIQAVTEFAERLGLQEPVHATKERFASWFVTKQG